MNDPEEVDRLLKCLFLCAERRIRPKISDRDGKLTVEIQGVSHDFNYDLLFTKDLFFLEEG